jgi:predicted solute-binding protein
MNIRIGCVQYLNARPLIHGWPGQVVFDHPSALCTQLARGDLDIALVSSFEFLRNPIYRIVDGVSVSSDGPVYSVVLVHAGNLSEIEEIELDPASATSANLLKCLIAGKKLAPRFISLSTSAITTKRARLLIGDQAIRFRQNPDGEFQFWDLGEQWKNLFDLPFVYALWLIRPEVVEPVEIANRLRATRDRNLANIDHLIANCSDPEFSGRYFREHLRFTFGGKEKEGLQTFANLCAKHNVLPLRDLAFDLA